MYLASHDDNQIRLFSRRHAGPTIIDPGVQIEGSVMHIKLAERQHTFYLEERDRLAVSALDESVLELTRNDQPWLTLVAAPTAPYTPHSPILLVTQGAALAQCVSAHAVRELIVFNATHLNALPWPADLANIERLRVLSSGATSDLAALARMPQLQGLELHHCSQLTDLGQLASLSSLFALYLRGAAQLTDLRPLTALRGLTTLALDGCPWLTDLHPLTPLTALNTLILAYCPALVDLSPLAGLTNLRRLDLHEGRAISDLTPLRGLRALRELNLDYCVSVRDFSPLQQLDNLEQVQCVDWEEEERLIRMVPGLDPHSPDYERHLEGMRMLRKTDPEAFERALNWD